MLALITINVSESSCGSLHITERIIEFALLLLKNSRNLKSSISCRQSREAKIALIDQVSLLEMLK
jgi:hypothetical protein